MPMPAPLCRAALALALLGLPAAAQPVSYGDDTGPYPLDGECDDRRFRGVAMSGVLDWQSLGRDASDCKMALEGGRAALWVFEEARAATECSAIKWGDDSSEYALDGVCDDPRFEGLGVAGLLYREDAGRDASDCRALCEHGLLFLRDY
jgi:hypothetical protein